MAAAGPSATSLRTWVDAITAWKRAPRGSAKWAARLARIEPLRQFSVLNVTRENPRDVAAPFELRQAVHDRTLQREVALPQAEHERVARQLRGCPLDGNALARGDLAGEQHLSH